MAPRGSRRRARPTPSCSSEAARLARYGHDFAQVERLGRAAVARRHDARGRAAARRGAARARRRSTRPSEVLTAAEAPAADDDELLVHITEIRSRNLMWGLSRHDEALEVNRAARDRLSGHRAREELTLNEAMLLTYSGRPLDTLAVLESADPPRTPRARALRALAEVPALVATGRCETAAEEAAAGVRRAAWSCPTRSRSRRPGCTSSPGSTPWPSAAGSPRPRPWPPAAYEATPPTAPPDAFMWLAHQLGRCALLCGRVETARRWLGEAARAMRGAATSSGRAGSCCPRSPRRMRGSATKRPRPRPRASSTSSRPSASPTPSRSSAGLGARRPRRPARRRGGVLRAAAELRGVRRLPRAPRRGCSTTSPGSAIRRRSSAGSRSSPRSARVSSSPPTPTHAEPRPHRAHRGARRRGRPVRAIGALLLAAEAATEAAQAFQHSGDRRGISGAERARLDPGRVVRRRTHSGA